MLINTEETNTRLNSPDNLLNRLKRLRPSKESLAVFTGLRDETNSKTASHPALPHSEDIESEIRDGLIRGSAKRVLGDALDLLENNLHEISDSPTRLAGVIAQVSKVVTALDDKKSSNINPNQVIIFKPMIHNESYYQSVQAHE